MRASVLCAVIFAFLLIFATANLRPSFLYAQSTGYFVSESTRTEGEIISKHTKIYYQNENDLRLLNKRLKLGTLDYLLKYKGSDDVSIESQVAAKVDIILERVKTILELNPKNLMVEIRITESPAEVQRIYFGKYSKKVDYPAFYARGEKTVYVAVNKINSNILAHELAHAIIDRSFGLIIPVKIHEILSQYVDANFEE